MPKRNQAFFAANKEMFGGMPYEMVEKDLRAYLQEQAAAGRGFASQHREC